MSEIYICKNATKLNSEPKEFIKPINKILTPFTIIFCYFVFHNLNKALGTRFSERQNGKRSFTMYHPKERKNISQQQHYGPNWCNKGHGMCYPVCGMVYIREPLFLIGKSSPCGGSRFPLSLSDWCFTICVTPYNRK